MGMCEAKLDRRGFNTLLAWLVFQCHFPVYAKDLKPSQFCSFSPINGWGKTGHINASSGEHEIKVTKVGKKDKSGVPEVIRRIEEAFDTSTNISVFLTNRREGNAYATVVDGQRMIVADIDFFTKVNSEAQTDWAAISIIAHEVGHHIDGFSGGIEGELRADYWSGQALWRLGASITAATACMAKYGNTEETISHPNKGRRIAAIERGWIDASKGVVDKQQCIAC